ncbi:MAG: YfiT family bacillithiol transferase [Saprospiraceae bacterium]|jgi:hypothetical protein
MDEIALEKLKFPIGRFHPPNQSDYSKFRPRWIQSLAKLPKEIREVTGGWTLEKWKTPYRPGGWSALQLIHHVSDSHSQALMRIKLALTEHQPTIKPYHEQKWGTLADSLLAHPETALSIIDGVHAKWSILLENLNAEEWNRTFIHPEYEEPFSLNSATALYVWHGNHHFAHLQNM